MKNKSLKINVFLILILFSIPVATAFCCCSDTESIFSHQEMTEHHHSHEQTSHDHHHDKSSPDTCECGHEIIGDINQQAINISALYFPIAHVPNKNLLIGVSQVSESNKPTFHFNDTGPPGQFSAVPLYLEVSVLRI